MYPPSVTAVMLNLLGSHDIARYLTLARGDRTALILATTFQMTYPGAPSIYYGDEIGMRGGHDPANRAAFPWHRHDLWDTELLHEFQRLTHLRRAHPALRRGTFHVLHASGGLFGHVRQSAEETLVVVFNTSRSNQVLDMHLKEVLPEGTILQDVWTHQTIKVEHALPNPLELSPRSSRILASEPTC
jgi:cyclomaltodextrinase / maltogenic alpha-amylase / neopullulanase